MWRDLRRRSIDQIRGPKWLWWVASSNLSGSTAYWLVGSEAFDCRCQHAVHPAEPEVWDTAAGPPRAVVVTCGGPTGEDPGGARTQRTHLRWYVHLGLPISLAAALVTLAYLSKSIALHAIVGLSFVACVAVHLGQRRRTVTRLATQLSLRRASTARSRGLATSDTVLVVLFANVLLSGVIDWVTGLPVRFPFPPPFNASVPKVSGLVFVVYGAVHIWHRRSRIRTSTVRSFDLQTEPQLHRVRVVSGLRWSPLGTHLSMARRASHWSGARVRPGAPSARLSDAHYGTPAAPPDLSIGADRQS